MKVETHEFLSPMMSYSTEFDHYQGLAHLEALEILSRQSSIKVIVEKYFFFSIYMHSVKSHTYLIIPYGKDFWLIHLTDQVLYLKLLLQDIKSQSSCLFTFNAFFFTNNLISCCVWLVEILMLW